VNLAEHYGVDFNLLLAHDAAYDCFIAGQVAQRQIERYGMPTNAAQAKWHREWAEHFMEYRAEQGEPVEIGKEWPE
jgi:DNA polymerase III epsilon subunit-like protein